MRGLAIVTMISANLSAKTLAEPHSFWLRLYGSFGAPLFIFLSGMMVVHGALRKGHGFSHFLLRGFLLLLVGAAVDLLIFRVYPFMTCDVLYLIGFSLPLAALFFRLPSGARWGLIVLLFFVSHLLQERFGYADYPLEYSLNQAIDLKNFPWARLLRNWLWEGWFPLLPWLGFSLLGAHVERRRLQEEGGSSGRGLLAVGLLFWVMGIALWRSAPGKLLLREGYSELFYPPVAGYLLTAAGAVFLLLYYGSLLKRPEIFRPIEIMGRASLLLYLSHLALIEYVVAPLTGPVDLLSFLLIYLSLTLFLMLLAAAVARLKSRVKDPPSLIRFLWGG